MKAKLLKFHCKNFEFCDDNYNTSFMSYIVEGCTDWEEVTDIEYGKLRFWVDRTNVDLKGDVKYLLVLEDAQCLRRSIKEQIAFEGEQERQRKEQQVIADARERKRKEEYKANKAERLRKQLAKLEKKLAEETK